MAYIDSSQMLCYSLKKKKEDCHLTDSLLSLKVPASSVANMKREIRCLLTMEIEVHSAVVALLLRLLYCGLLELYLSIVMKLVQLHAADGSNEIC